MIAMDIYYLKKAVTEDGNDFYFNYGGVNCGIEIHGTLEEFDLLYGDESKKVGGGFEAAIREPFFNGKSVLDIFDAVADTIRFV